MAAINPTKSMTLKLAPETVSALATLAESRQRTSHWLMRKAVEEYVQREQKRDAFNKATTAAWDEYQAQGLHLTAAEADAWMADLEAGKDVEPPSCHV